MNVAVTVAALSAPRLPDHDPAVAPLTEWWSRLVEPLPPDGGDGDREEWIEMAVRVGAVADLVGPEKTWIRQSDNTLTRFSDGTVRRCADLDPRTPDLGITRGRHQRPVAACDRLAAAYPDLATFRQHAGRPFESATFASGDEHDVEHALERLWAAGATRAVVKGRETKSLLAVVEHGQTLLDALDDPWSAIRLEGRTGALSVQPWVPMRFEYRVFVVGGHPITGAGAILERTPLDNDGTPFPAALREDRAASSEPFDAPHVRDTLVGFADRVCAQLRREVPLMGNYVIDVALGEGDVPLIVELNDLPNSGRFASDEVALCRALLKPPGLSGVARLADRQQTSA